MKMPTKQGIILLNAIIFTFASDFRIVCYYYNRSAYKLARPEDLNPSLCTHLMYAFIHVNNEGNLTSDNVELDINQGLYQRVVELKRYNKRLKVLLSVGDTKPEIFSNVAANLTKRKTFAQSARFYLSKFGFDGLDLDWETPLKTDKQNFISLIRDLRSEFKNTNWLITAAVCPIPSEGYDIPALNTLLDFANLMSYNFYGPWSNYTGQNSALFESKIESRYEKMYLNVAAAATNWINAGIESEKLSVGLAFYGRSFTLKTSDNFTLHAPIIRDGSANRVKTPSYFFICQKYSNWSTIWDDEQKNPIKHSGNQWLGYDNDQSISLKVEYILAEKYGGVMIWQIALDDVYGTCKILSETSFRKTKNLYRKLHVKLVLINFDNFEFQTLAMEDEKTENEITEEVPPEETEANDIPAPVTDSVPDLVADPVSGEDPVQEQQEKPDEVVNVTPEAPPVEATEEKLEEKGNVTKEETTVEEDKISLDVSENKLKLDKDISFSEMEVKGSKDLDYITTPKFSLSDQKSKENHIKDRKSYVTSSLTEEASSKYNKRKSKIQERNKDRMRQALGSIIEFHQPSMYAGEARLGRYMNSYKLESDNPFNPEKVEKILKDVLLETMENMTYDKDNCPKQAMLASDLIRKKVKELEFDRYKIIVIVTIGEKNCQDILTTCNFLWDIEKDRYAYYSTENSYVFGVAQCFGLYYE